MPKAIQISVANADEIARQLQARGAAAGAIVAQVVVAVAEALEPYAESLAPGPHLEVTLESQSRQNATAALGPDRKHWYYKFFEFGTRPHGPRKAKIMLNPEHTLFAHWVRGVAARPFLRPTADTQGETARQTAADAFNRVLGGD